MVNYNVPKIDYLKHILDTSPYVFLLCRFMQAIYKPREPGEIYSLTRLGGAVLLPNVSWDTLRVSGIDNGWMDYQGWN